MTTEKISALLDTLTSIPTGNISASDLATLIDEGAECVAYQAGPSNAERVQILFFPSEGRAGIAWGGNSVWTDCDSARDALERYLGVDGKEMRE